ncbi:hypothetical protein ACWEQG_01765 [Microbispora sp. NPDC004025]
MLFMAPTPSPVPTVTVTQTVPIFTTAPTPVITVVPPPDGIDFWKDIVWGDFGGAIVGAVLAIAGSVAVTVYLIRKEREAREAADEHERQVREEADRKAFEARVDERRRDRAERLALAFRQLAFTVTKSNIGSVMASLGEVMNAASPLAAIPDERYAPFREWLSERMTELIGTWVPEYEATFDMNDQDKVSAWVALGTWAGALAELTDKWAADPDGWEPSSREEIAAEVAKRRAARASKTSVR